MRYLSLFTWIIFGFFIQKAQCQAPAHFWLGEKTFTGVDIYDIYEDRDHNYWVTSDNGLYFYDGYEFQTVPCTQQLATSVFNPQADGEGAIYCNNLSGQIFQIQPNFDCEVYFQIPDSLLGPMVIMHVEPNGDIIISSRYLFRIRNREIIHVYKDYPIRYPLAFIRTGENLELVGYINEELTILTFRPGELALDIQPIATPVTLSDPALKINFKDKEIIYQRNEGVLSLIRNDSLIHPKRIEPYLSNIAYARGLFWGLSNKVGLFITSDIFNTASSRTIYFPRVKVSSIMVDHEDNILLGTFDHGIIVIPDSKIKTYKVDERSGEVSNICRADDAAIIYATSTGYLGKMYLDGRQDSLTQAEGYVELLSYIPANKEVIVGCTQSFNYDLIRREKNYMVSGSLKDVKYLPGDQFLFATNVGVQIYNASDSTTGRPSLPSNHSVLKPVNKIYDQRTNCVLFDPHGKAYFAGSMGGLKRINQSGIQPLRDGDREIIGKEILQIDQYVYVATKDRGIYVFEGDQQIDHWTDSTSLHSNAIMAITTDGQRLFMATDKGIQVCDKNGETILYLNQSDGLNGENAIDLVINGQTLWVLFQNVIQSIDLNAYESFDFTPEIELSSIFVNDSLIDPQGLNRFHYRQNKWTFSFASKSLKYRNEIQYQYRLNGIDSDWVTNAYEDNSVTYKSLPPGNYTFDLQAVFRGNESRLVTYSFIIQPAFWNAWWFSLLIFLIMLVFFLLIFRYALNRQKRRAKMREELQESKLIAIQAQMNPHFIFNALNSIQDLVLKNEAEEAYDYISKFALLVRNTLNKSDQEYIPFNEEMNDLHLYLSLEKLRFKSNFTFQIHPPDQQEILIPPMLIQPFIENSIIHGLMHKEGEKRLTVTFEVDDALKCVVTDNGIGRKVSKEIQKRQFGQHKSFASSAIDKRLEILSSRHDGEFSVRYEDLLDAGKAAGTKVILNIPFTHPY